MLDMCSMDIADADQRKRLWRAVEGGAHLIIGLTATARPSGTSSARREKCAQLMESVYRYQVKQGGDFMHSNNATEQSLIQYMQFAKSTRVNKGCNVITNSECISETIFT